MVSGDLEKPREPKWQPGTPEAELELLFSNTEKIDSASERRIWMASTIHRLKNRGKSHVAIGVPCGLGAVR